MTRVKPEVEPDDAALSDADAPAALTARPFLIGLVVLALVLTVVVIAGVALSRADGSSSVSSGTGTGTSSEAGNSPSINDSSSGSGGSTDPIEQARYVLATTWGSSATYDEIKSVTDSALRATGNSPTDEMRSRAWSAVLVVSDENSINPMTVMGCVLVNGTQASMTFPDLAAVCALTGG